MSLTKTAAGARGDNVRSDCFVEIDWRSRGNREIIIESKVATLYGRSLKKLLGGMSSHFNVLRARIRLEDKGALPYVVAARFEAAVRRHHAQTQDYVVSSKHKRQPSAKDRTRRSRLYLPGNEPKFFLNAALHAPDCIILDLEDSVPPEEKDAARILVRNALRSADFRQCEVSVRINQGPLGIEDLKMTAAHHVQVVYVPKVETAQQVRDVEAFLDESDKRIGGRWRTLIIPIIESARGIVHAYEIASSSDRVCALAIGLEDYTADIGVPRTIEGRESLFARSAVVNAAKAAGVQALDSVFSDVTAMEDLARSTAESRALGFDGRGCIHPRQIRVIHEAFVPSDEEIRRAADIVVAHDLARREGKGVVALGSKMIDAPVVKRALKVIAGAVASGKLRKHWRRNYALPERQTSSTSETAEA
jgi:citrate lyase subunit beta/citryl-CoA lyase